MKNLNNTTVEIFNKLEQPSDIKTDTITAIVLAKILTQKDGQTRLEMFMKNNPRIIYEMISEAKKGINLIDVEIPVNCPIQSAKEYCYYIIMRKTNLVQSDKQEFNQDLFNKYKPIIDLNYGPEGAVYLRGEGKKVIDAALQSFNTMKHEEIVKILGNMTDINAAEILILMKNEKIGEILSDIKDNKFTGILSRIRGSGSVDNERYGKILEAMSDDMLLNKIFLPTISDQSCIYYDLLEILNLMSKKKALRILENLSDEIIAEILATNGDENEAKSYYNKMPKQRAANIASIIKYPIISRL